ncbi:TerC family protein [Snodgrassella sp. CFCC 13594]|uniref:TerC family protein n=1 Tax=Snodgrassella sp. CFCC 13594 TaxID=1775559 RepID=UPI000833AC12|nr:TerC family protein [Snodgrassella sp. CFCC 13594]
MPHPHITSVGTPLFYAVFFAVVLLMIVIDMLTLKKEGVHKVSTKEALLWSIVWVTVSLAFAVWLYFELAGNPQVGPVVAKDKVLAYLTGYVLEKSLAVDNIFVFVLIFSYFKVPAAYQHRVLLYGVLGAIVLRAIMVWLGAVLVSEFEWVLYLFGVFLVYSGIKMMLPEKGEPADFGENPAVKWLTRHIHISKNFDKEKFFTIENGKRVGTPLLLVLIVVELSDVVFAVDSIPAVFAVTTDPFIVLTSNIFAVLGLRAMYFLLANVVEKFTYLKFGLAFVLTFIGVKMLIAGWYHIPTHISLLVVFSALLLSILASWLKQEKQA